MSRIGKQPIKIPENVEIKINEDLIMVKGSKGELSQKISSEIKVELKEAVSNKKSKEILVVPMKKNKKTPALWGLTRALIFNMVKGVTEGFEKKLEIEGVGYRVTLQDNKPRTFSEQKRLGAKRSSEKVRGKLVLNLGYSHPIEIETPKGIEFKVEKNVITVSGTDKQLVGQIAASIRDKRKPEPYKGKGIRYSGEIIRRKAGKKATTAE